VVILWHFIHNPSSQKQKLVTDNFSGTLADSHHANPKICPIIHSHKNTALFACPHKVKSVDLSAVNLLIANLQKNQR
jgi:hypothetical protein